MSWYLAKIVFKIVSSELSSQAQFDEQLCMIEARDEPEAFIRSKR